MNIRIQFRARGKHHQLQVPLYFVAFYAAKNKISLNGAINRLTSTCKNSVTETNRVNADMIKKHILYDSLTPSQQTKFSMFRNQYKQLSTWGGLVNEIN